MDGGSRRIGPNLNRSLGDTVMADFSNSTPVPAVSNIATHPREQLRQLRNRMAQAVEILIAAMDAIDGDPDMEPSLGSVGAEIVYFDQRKWAQGVTDDREVECEDEGAQCDDEGHDSDTEPNGDEDDYSPCEDQLQPSDLWAARNRDYASITGLLPKVMNLGFHGPVI